MTPRWFFSRTLRQAADLCHRTQKLVNHQRDLLPPQAIESLAQARGRVQSVRAAGAESVAAAAAELEKTASKWLKPYPHASLRENIDVILVAIVIAMGIRTFFLQPMAIPTGSMQPTLYGITVENLKENAGAAPPGWFMRRFDSWFRGISYYRVVAGADGPVQRIEPPRQILPFVRKQRFWQGGKDYEIWFPPGTLPSHQNIPPEQLLFFHAGIEPGRVYRAGETIIDLKVQSGDRLFADRLTYNFRRPRRGEIVIFASQGIPQLTQDTHYIKRLVAMGGESVRIGNDRHVIVDDQRLDAATCGFENIYSFTGPPRESQYSGHVNNHVAEKQGWHPIAPEFPDETKAMSVAPKHYFVLGDNTMNSFDSRYWGVFPREKVIGKCAFVFWPVSERFGWGFR